MLCTCKVCKSKDPKDSRLRASVWIETRGKSFLIDTSTDLRQQTFKNKIPRVDAVLYTHPHADHISGIDEIRAFNFAQKSKIPIFVHDWTRQELITRYPYLFNSAPVEGGAIPQLDMKNFNPTDPELIAEGVRFIPISVQHGSKTVSGFRIDDVAYITDCHYIPKESLDRLRGLKVLVLDCVRINPHNTHLNFDQALSVIQDLKPKQAYLTHLGHDFGHKAWSKKLPKGISLAFDGLKITW